MMDSVQETIKEKFGEMLRVRVCGVCIQNDQILLVQHKGLGKTGMLWSPPGGGMEYGESATVALTREFKEETGLDIFVKEFLFVHEYLDPPLHGIELFFEVEITGGKLKLGVDPEICSTNQILTEVSFKDLKALQLSDSESLHYVLQNLKEPKTLINQKGYFKFH